MKRFRVLFVALLPLLFLLSAPALLVAKTPPRAEALEIVPSQSKLVMGVNVEKLRSSFLFDELLALVKRLQGESDVLSFLLTDSGVDLKKDLRSIVVAQADASLSPSTSRPDVVIVIDGDVDEKRLVAAARKRFETLSSEELTEELKTYDTGSFRFAVLSPRRLVFTTASGDYEAAIWKAVAGKGKGAWSSAKLGALLKATDTSRSAWVVALTGHMTQPGMPVAESSTMEFDLDGKGLDLEIVSMMTSDDGAKTTLEQMVTLKKQNASNPMVEMLGATPLLANMKATRDGRAVVLETSMTEPQLKTMFARIKVMAQQPGMMPSGGAPPASAPTAPTKAAPRGGVEADFN